MTEATLLEKLKRLSAVQTARDILPLSYAQFPGTHCPLFGVALTTWNIRGLAVLVLGVEECAYYTKNFVMMRARNDAAVGSDLFFSGCLSQQDVIFGCRDAIGQALQEIERRSAPEAILIVSTCIPELIGEDLEAELPVWQERLGGRLLLVKTDHFSCKNHIPGIERALAALADLMTDQPLRAGSVNLLGQRYRNLDETELVQNLRRKGIAVHLELPCSGSVQSIREAPAAALNIVTDPSGLPLARRMKERFGREYVSFPRYVAPERIAAAYGAIAAALRIDLAEEIEDGRRATERLIAEYQPDLQGTTYIYGNSPLLPLELAEFLARLEMTPLLIQLRELYPGAEVDGAALLAAGHDPYVTRVANIAPLQSLYGQLRPNFYLGHESPERLAGHGIRQVVLDRLAARTGFEVTVNLMRQIGAAAQHNATPGKETRHAAV